MPTPPEGFTDTLAALPADRFTAFVADLWAARGYAVREVNGPLSATHPAGGGLVIVPTTAEVTGTISATVDLVVSATVDSPRVSDVDCRGPRELSELVRYAVQSTESDRLVETYLGLEPAEMAPSGAGASLPDRPVAMRVLGTLRRMRWQLSEARPGTPRVPVAGRRLILGPGVGRLDGGLSSWRPGASWPESPWVPPAG